MTNKEEQLRGKWERRFSGVNRVSFELHLNQRVSDVADFWLEQRSQEFTELRRKIKEMPTFCGRCDKQGINNYGECKCSYEENVYVEKEDVLSLLPEVE